MSQLRVYAEASKPKDSTLLTVSALLGQPFKWKRLQDDWKLWRAEAGIEHFHTTDFMNPQHPIYGTWSDTKRETVVSHLIRLINETAIAGLSVTLNVVDFDDLAPEDKALCGNNPYALTAAQCIGYVAKILEEDLRKLNGEVFWVVSVGDDGGKAFFKQMQILPLESARVLRLLNIQPGEQTRWPALDTVDFLAWHEMNNAKAYRDSGHPIAPSGYLARLTVPLLHHYMAGDTLLDWACDNTPAQRAAITKLFGVHARGPIASQKRSRWSRPLS